MNDLNCAKCQNPRLKKCTGGRRSLETAFRRKPDCGFGIFILYNMY